MTIDAATILSIYSAILTLLIGVIGFFLMRTFKELDNKVSTKEMEIAKKDIEENTEDIRRIRIITLPRTTIFVNRQRSTRN